MKLNSRKKNTGKKVKSLFFVLFFLLTLFWFRNDILLLILDLKNKIEISFSDKEKIFEENKELKEKISNFELEDLMREYDDSFLDNFSERKKIKIFLDENNIFKARTLKKDDKIKIGDKVYFYKNILYGVVDSIDERFISIKSYSSHNFENNYLILSAENEVIYRGPGFGDTNGIIKLDLPRRLEVDKNSLLIIDDGSGDIVGKFEKDDYQKQESKREVYFKLLKNPYTVYQVEI